MSNTRVLIVGGGVAGLEALLTLRELASELVDTTLLSSAEDFTYRPMAVAEPFGLGKSWRYDLAAICADQRTRFRVGRVERVNTAEAVVETDDGGRLEYDALLLALGARPEPVLEGSVTVQGPGYTSSFRTLLRDLDRPRGASRVVFAVPPAIAWPLPLYELALMTAERFPERGPRIPGSRAVDIAFVTPESAPLEMFGPQASQEVGELFASRGIEFIPDHQATRVTEGAVEVLPAIEGGVPADRVVSLPRLRGPAVAGLPQSGDGFLPVDNHCRVMGHRDVFGAGDCTSFAIKQGGIAAQQAEAAAQAIAALAGAAIQPAPFRPVMRGLLLTGDTPRYMRAEVAGGRGENWAVSEEPLWWPPGKIAARHLTPYLSAHDELGRSVGGSTTEPVPDEQLRRLAFISSDLPGGLVDAEDQSR